MGKTLTGATMRSAGFANAAALVLTLASAAPVPPRQAPPKYDVWFGEGCFWERQYAYVMLELNQTGPFNRTHKELSSVVGYAGANITGDDGLVCYDNGSSNDYGALGHCETVGLNLDRGKEQQQFEALVIDFLDSFTATEQGFMRPDLPPLLPFGDVGAPYRTVLGLPGGMHGPLFSILQAHNKPRGPYNMSMNLKPDLTGNMTQDEVNTVWVMDSLVFPFYRAETYHQYHSNFFHNPQQPAAYPTWYVQDLYKEQVSLGNIPSNGCPDSYCPPDSSGNCHY